MGQGGWGAHGAIFVLVEFSHFFKLENLDPEWFSDMQWSQRKLVDKQTLSPIFITHHLYSFFKLTIIVTSCILFPKEVKVAHKSAYNAVRLMSTKIRQKESYTSFHHTQCCQTDLPRVISFPVTRLLNDVPKAFVIFPQLPFQTCSPIVPFYSSSHTGQ